MAGAGVTVFAIKSAQAEAKRTGKRVTKRDGRGLFFCALPSGDESWVVYFRVRGRKELVKITNKERGVSIAGARKWAAAIRFKAARGVDPRDEQREAKSKAAEADANTLQSVCERYLALEGKKLRTVERRRADLKRLVYGQIGDRPILSVKRGDIVRLLDKIEEQRGPVMADMMLRVLSRIMRWHAVRDENYTPVIVPGMGRSNPKERARLRILTDDELRRVWATATTSDGPFPAFVRFLLLTATRRNEAARMVLSEIEPRKSLEHGVAWPRESVDWVIPGPRCKTKKDAVVPLSPAAKAILDAMPRIDGCPYPFSANGTRPVTNFSAFKRRFDEACSVQAWRLHDLRRSARSLLSRAGVDADVAERCLNHSLGGMRAIYDRYEFRDEKAKAFEAALIARIVDGPQQQNVVEMRGG
jgi:integrase